MAEHLQVEIKLPEARQQFCTLRGLPPIDPKLLEIQNPQAMWLLTDGAGHITARSSLWWRQTPIHARHKLGLIGHYGALSIRSGAQMLNWVCAQLAARGCTLAVGPMDGSTWHNYRLIVERGDEPVFLFEPDNPDDWPDHFLSNGFAEFAGYYSALNADLSQQGLDLSKVKSRLERCGVQIRPLCLNDLTNELRQIHALSNECFRDSFLFTPITWEDFLGQYQGLSDSVLSELILVAERAGKMLGFIFALPDMLQRRRQPIDTVIIKTLAASPRLPGLGQLLATECHEAARRLGYKRVIHALMRDTSPARKISERIAQPMRRYALFARPLEHG